MHECTHNGCTGRTGCRFPVPNATAVEVLNGYTIHASAHVGDADRVLLGERIHADGGSSFVVATAPRREYADTYRGWYSGEYFDGSGKLGREGARREWFRRVSEAWHLG